MSVYVNGNTLLERLKRKKVLAQETIQDKDSFILKGYLLAYDHIIRTIEQEMLYQSDMQAEIEEEADCKAKCSSIFREVD